MSETITIRDVYREIKKLESNMITRKEIEEFVETVDILSDSELMEQIRKSDADIKAGRTTEISSVKNLL